MNAHESENIKKRENKMAMPTMKRVPRGSMPAFVRLRTAFAADGFLGFVPPDLAYFGGATWDRVDAFEGALISPVVERNEWRVDIAERAKGKKGVKRKEVCGLERRVQQPEAGTANLRAPCGVDDTYRLRRGGGDAHHVCPM